VVPDATVPISGIRALGFYQGTTYFTGYSRFPWFSADLAPELQSQETRAPHPQRSSRHYQTCVATWQWRGNTNATQTLQPHQFFSTLTDNDFLNPKLAAVAVLGGLAKLFQAGRH